MKFKIDISRNSELDKHYEYIEKQGLSFYLNKSENISHNLIINTNYIHS